MNVAVSFDLGNRKFVTSLRCRWGAGPDRKAIRNADLDTGEAFHLLIAMAGAGRNSAVGNDNCRWARPVGCYDCPVCSCLRGFLDASVRRDLDQPCSKQDIYDSPSASGHDSCQPARVPICLV